jgi:hypothetical protein
MLLVMSLGYGIAEYVAWRPRPELAKRTALLQDALVTEVIQPSSNNIVWAIATRVRLRACRWAALKRCKSG